MRAGEWPRLGKNAITIAAAATSAAMPNATQRRRNRLTRMSARTCLASIGGLRQAEPPGSASPSGRGTSRKTRPIAVSACWTRWKTSANSRLPANWTPRKANSGSEGRRSAERIAEQEGLSVDDAEVEATLARIAVHSGKEVTEVRKFYQERDLTGALKEQLRAEKAMKLLLDEAKVNDAPQAEETAPEAKE